MYINVALYSHVPRSRLCGPATDFAVTQLRNKLGRIMYLHLPFYLCFCHE